MESENESYQCGYCLMEVEHMTKPKFLPCGHLFCSPCLESDYRYSPQIVCITCRKEHGNLDLNSLKNHTIKSTQLPKCDLCDLSDGNLAVKFCAKCDKTLCSSHVQAHERMVEAMRKFDNDHTSHILVDIDPSDHYERIRRQNGEYKCSLHTSREIEVTCTQCHALLCDECLPESHCSDGDGHILMKADEFCDQIKAGIDSDLKLLFEKSSKTTELEKAILCLLEERQNECEKMKRCIVKVTKEQIKAIKQKSSKLTAEIDEYYESCAEIVEKYLNDLGNTKETLDSLRKDLHILKHQKTPMTVLLSEFSTAKSRANEELEKRFANISLPTKNLVPLEKKRDLEMALSTSACNDVLRNMTLSEPEKITHLQSGKVNYTRNRSTSDFHLVHWTSNGNILCGDRERIQVLKEDLSLLFSFPPAYGSASTLGSDFLLLESNYKGYVIDIFSDRFEKEETLYSFINHDEQFPKYTTGSVKLSSSADRFAVADNIMKVLQVFDAEGTPLAKLVFLSFFPSVTEILLLNDEAILVMGKHVTGKRSSSSLYKFYLEDMMTPAWKSKFEIQATGLAVDDAGYIYVSESDCIHLLSHSGKVLKVLQCGKLNQINSISISADEMAVACQNQIHIFKICC